MSVRQTCPREKSVIQAVKLVNQTEEMVHPVPHSWEIPPALETDGTSWAGRKATRTSVRRNSSRGIAWFAIKSPESRIMFICFRAIGDRLPLYVVASNNRKMSQLGHFEMSTDEHSTSTPSSQPECSGREELALLYSQYLEIVSEQSPVFLAEKRMIEESFAQQLRIIDNFRKSKREIVMQEALYMQQVGAQSQADL